MSETIKVLLVEDEKIDQLAFSRFAQREGLPYEITIVDSISGARSILQAQKFDIVLVDYFVGADTALDLLGETRGLPFIVITGLGGEEIAVKAMKLGASDYLTKDADGNYLKMLPQVVSSAIRLKQTENELIRYRENLEKMVVERTEKLTLINEQLREEIRERERAEAQVLLQATALESAVNGIMITDVAGQILWVNPSLEKMMGYVLDEIVGKQPDVFRQQQQDRAPFKELWGLVQSGQSWRGEIPVHRRDGSQYVMEMTVTPVISRAGKTTHFIAICQDITESIRAEEQLRYQATHDMLTGLPNRLLFNDRLNHALAIAKRTGQQGAVFLVDLDDFKAINDAFTHDEGDAFLILMAKRFAECLRESDTVARIGGDEFAVLLDDIDQQDIGMVAQKLNQALSAPTKIRGNVIVSTASIGISVFPQDGNAVQILLKNADLAMYRAKEEKNSFQFYNKEMVVSVEKQLELTNYLRYALQNDIFQLHYQPQVDARTGQIIGLEALLRLPHPELQWIPPGEYIPLAERMGLIVPVDEWVLKKAAKKASQLLHTGFRNFKISINISVRMLNQSNLIEILEGVLKDNALDPGFLELEISESGIFQNIEKTIETLSKLKSMGLRLAVDDFGTGYASLNYLARFPLDILKIDLSFTRKILSSPRDAAIVTGVVAIANDLGLGVIVEGVEKRGQMEFFFDLGCHVIQGFFFSPAVSGNDLEILLNRGFSAFAYA